MKQQQQNSLLNNQQVQTFRQNYDDQRIINKINQNVMRDEQEVQINQSNIKNRIRNQNHVRIGSIKKNVNKIQERDKDRRQSNQRQLFEGTIKSDRQDGFNYKQEIIQKSQRYSNKNAQKVFITNINKSINTSDYNPTTQFTNYHNYSNNHELIGRPSTNEAHQAQSKKNIKQNNDKQPRLKFGSKNLSTPNLKQKQKQYKQHQNKTKIQQQQQQINKYFNNQSDNQDQYIGGEQIKIDLWNKNYEDQNKQYKKSKQKQNNRIKEKQHQKQRVNLLQKYGKKQEKQEILKKNKKYNQYETSGKEQLQEDDYNFNYKKYRDFSNQNINGKSLKKQQRFSSNNHKSINSKDFNSQIKMRNNEYENYDMQSYPSQFIDSRQQSYSNNKNQKQLKYGPGGIQTLQFNTQKQKIIILDSKQTQGLNPNLQNLLKSFCEDIQIPRLQKLPVFDNTPQELVSIAKDCFYKFGCSLNDQTVISVKKYKNCVHFSISNQNNILYHYDNGKLYYGAWKAFGSSQGQKHGEGIEILPGRYKFKGFFVEGKKSGYGTLINFDGSAYVGQWENGYKHGQGKYIDTEGILYQGEWKQGKKSGYGKIINNNRLQYEGVFMKGLKNGYGKQYFENGDTYDGNYLNHKFNGKGTYSWRSGASYTGQFKNGKRNGYGVWKSANNNYDIYQGQYLDDKKNGYGIYKWVNGAIYQGQFKQDLKHGNGTITYENGKVAHLVWINGKAQRKLQGISKQKIRNEQNYQPQLSQRKLLKKPNQFINPTQSKQKTTNFILRSRPASRSAQNLMSAHSSSTVNSNNFPKGITFNTRSANKLGKTSQTSRHSYKKDDQKIIRLKFDNNQFQKAIGKNFNKNITGNNKIKQEKKIRPDIPKDRPYQGIQATSNINIEM